MHILKRFLSFETIYNSRLVPLLRNLSIIYLLKIIERNFKNKFFLKNFEEYIANILNNIDFDVQYKKNELPIKTAIEITNTCNLNCIMCNTKLSKRPAGYIKPKAFELILKKLANIGINRIAIHTVGEPFMYKNLDRLFQIINKHNFEVNLSTNGQFPKRLQNLLYSYSKLINIIRFSIDGAKLETYEKIRIGAKFERLIKSLEIVHKFNRNKIDYNISVKIDSILSMTNIYEIAHFFKVFKKYCWEESINFNIVNGLSPDTKYFWEAFPFPNLIKKMVPCILPFKYIYFTYDGKVTLCCRDYDGELIVEDLNNHSIVEIWNNDNSESIRHQHLNPEQLTIKACKKCYETYPFITDITNKFIHFMHFHYPNLSDQEFGIKVIALLKDMDNVMKYKDKNLIKQNISKHFTKIFN